MIMITLRDHTKGFAKMVNFRVSDRIITYETATKLKFEVPMSWFDDRKKQVESPIKAIRFSKFIKKAIG